MAHFPFLTYFSHVLPLDYELSLTPYEIICKLLKWLDGLTDQVNVDTAAIQDLQARVKDLEDKGFTNEQLREVLDEMVADGEFDFLIDLITAKTELWDTVGLTPYAQVTPEMVGLPIAGYSFQSMAMGDVGGTMVGMFCFNHKTGDTVDGSLVISINLATGLVIDYDTTNKGAMNSLGFNPTDSNFYMVAGGDSTEIVVYDYQCNIINTITDSDTNYKAGGITFKSNGNAIIVWYSKIASEATVIITEYKNLELRASVSPVQNYVQTNTWLRPYIYSVGRQDIYCDDVYLYLPTYWHKNAEDESYHWTTYNKQDVFTLNDLEYYRTQYIDCRNEVESGCCLYDRYFIGVNLSNSGLIFRASVHADNEYNSAYVNVSQLSNTEYNYGPYTLYGDGDSTDFFADGTIEHPIKRLMALQLISLPYARYTGVKFYLTGDFTSSGQITSMSFRNSRQRLIIQGHDGCILPKLTFDNCSRVALQDVTVRGYDSNYICYFFDTPMANLTNVKFVNGDISHTIAAVLLAENSLVNAVSGDNGEHIGFDGTTPTNYVKTNIGGRVTGSFYKDYDTTGSGTYITMGEFSFTKSANLTGNVLALMTDNGLHVTGQLTAGADFAANAQLLSLPSDNKQLLTSLVKERGSGVYLTAAADDAALALYYDYSTDKITTLGAIDNGTTIYINDVIPLESVNV